MPYLSARGVTARRGIADADIDLKRVTSWGSPGSSALDAPRPRGPSGIDRVEAGIITIAGSPSPLSGALARPCRSGSSTRPRIAEPRASSPTSACSTTSPSHCRPTAASSAASRPPDGASSPQLGGGARHPSRRPRSPRRDAVGRQPAEGAAGAAAGTVAAGAILDEPTRGIDVGAKVEIQNLVAEMRRTDSR